ncbi:hypothetical protein CFC21_001813 [Triticum aestivum]|uniref:Uncharacterized protein n=1 Tax=Triticum aestivum TaxID=4565 RepID=A0A3B5XYP2_WHEAT|nr:CLAVATA3/ESR (CLE)-related protein 14 [Triticum dicoccoides]XP_044398470.1 CLAVATA3/ESR (CLE)-related protein 14 [Triticum aestivum]XP_048552670.1 CLAVATA3/ESR (CLE)-related protein 14 [Triticum urartu]KAF6983674.1 hypothetical protein CFC21_001813 [Triticum aestivum]
MARSRDTRLRLRLTLLLVTLLLLVDMASVSHGRRTPDVDAMALVGGGPPPAKAYSSEQSSSSTSREHTARVYRRMHRVSKRLVPQGPNPLHN